MRKVTIIAFILLILLQCGIKAGIVAYYHVNRQYIATELCENKDNATMNCKGKCYLTKKIKQQEKQESKLASILKELKDCQGFLPSTESVVSAPYVFFVEAQYGLYLDKSYTAPLADILQPPC